MRAARYFAAVDSHTEGMPTRVITGGVGPIPGATMLERRRTSWRDMDDLRLLLMREPRGPRRMSGAILQPPTRAGRRLGRRCSSRSRAACRCAGTGRSASPRCWSRPGWSRSPSPRRSCGSTRPPGWSRRGSRSRTAARASVTLRNVPSFLLARDRVGRGPTGIGAVAYDMAFGGNFYAIVDGGGDRASRSIPARAGELIERGAGRSWRRSTRPTRPVHPDDAAHRAAATTWSSTRPGATAPTPARRPRSIRAGSTARRAAPGRRRGWRSCTRAASSRSARRSSTSR